MLYNIWKSDRKTKKFCVVIVCPNVREKRIYFGAAAYEDYTTHKDIDRMRRYEARHKAKEHWNDPLTPGFWAKWILWNLPSFKESVDDTENRFNIQIKVHRGIIKK